MVNVNLHYNGNIVTIPVEGSTAITLEGNWYKTNSNSYSYNGYDYTDIIYTDGNGTKRTERVINDVYFNGDYDLSYTGNQYSLLTNTNKCGSDGIDIQYTGLSYDSNITNTGNIFSNFVDNGLSVVFTNLPAIITYCFIVFIIIFLIRIFRK